MDPAVLALLGVALGGLIGGLAPWVLDRRAERAEFRAAFWVMGDDLTLLQQALANRPTGPLGGGHSVPHGQAWTIADRWTPADRRILARGLGVDVDTWSHLRDVLTTTPKLHAALLERWDAVAARQPIRPGEIGFIPKLDDDLTAAVQRALDGLEPYLEWRVSRRSKRAKRRALAQRDDGS